MTATAYGITLHLDDMVNGYIDVVDTIMNRGAFAAPRGVPTREVLGITLVVDASAPMLPVGVGRGVNQKLAAEEALQVIGGYTDPGALFAINPHLREFADGGAFHGAYGPRIGPQMELVRRRLTDDPASRRAVVTIWDPMRDAAEGVKNYPCTTMLQFMVRDEKVDCHVTMRANDAWHGLAYDAFVFSQLQLTLARVLQRSAGKYVHHASSMHVYEEHFDVTERLEFTADEFHMPLLPFGVKSFVRARQIGDGSMVASADSSEQWYIEKIAAARVPA